MEPAIFTHVRAFNLSRKPYNTISCNMGTSYQSIISYDTIFTNVCRTFNYSVLKYSYIVINYYFTFYYSDAEKPALKDINLEIQDGEFVLVPVHQVGENRVSAGASMA